MSLQTHGMVSVRRSGPSLPCVLKLKLLRDRERAWKYLSWRNSYILDLPETGSVYEFVGGFYGNGKEDETDRRLAPTISFFQLPSVINEGNPAGGGGKKWCHTLFHLSIIDFTMDPLQDLLVLVAAAPSE